MPIEYWFSFVLDGFLLSEGLVVRLSSASTGLALAPALISWGPLRLPSSKNLDRLSTDDGGATGPDTDLDAVFNGFSTFIPVSRR